MDDVHRKNGYKFLSFLQRTFKVKINMDVTKLELMDYGKLWECVINRKPTDEKRIPGAFTGWDNTPRKRKTWSGGKTMQVRNYFINIFSKQNQAG